MEFVLAAGVKHGTKCVLGRKTVITEHFADIQKIYSAVIHVLTIDFVCVSIQELAREEQDWAVEMESVENHRKLLEKKVTYGYDEAVQQLKVSQQQ